MLAVERSRPRTQEGMHSPGQSCDTASQPSLPSIRYTQSYNPLTNATGCSGCLFHLGLTDSQSNSCVGPDDPTHHRAASLLPRIHTHFIPGMTTLHHCLSLQQPEWPLTPCPVSGNVPLDLFRSSCTGLRILLLCLPSCPPRSTSSPELTMHVPYIAVLSHGLK